MRRFFLLLVCLGICSTARGQFYSYSQLDSLVNSWATSIQADYPSRAIKMKSIDYPNYCYRIVGYFLKGVLAEGQIVKIIDCKDEAHTLVEGRVSYEQNRLIVTGIKYDYSDGCVKEIYGSFIITNSDEGIMCYKPKKAKGIVINDYALQYYRGYYMNCPVIVCLGDKPYIGVDGKTGGRGYTEFTAPLVRSNLHDIGYSNPYELLLTTSQNAQIKWSDGMTFRGEVLPKMDENGFITFYNLAGTRSGYTSVNKELRVLEDARSISIELIDDSDNSLKKKEKIVVSNKALIPKDSYWEIPLYLENMDGYYAEFRNGDIFEGEAVFIHDDVNSYKGAIELKEGLYKYIDGSSFNGIFADGNRSEGTYTYSNGDKFEGSFINGNPAKGVLLLNIGDQFNGDLQSGEGTYYYANGDRFEGNIKSQWGSLFFDGTTYFKNGTQVNGNWLSIGSFTDDQWDQLKRCTSPSDAALQASFFTRTNNYIVIDHSGSFSSFGIGSKYFDPDWGESKWLGGDYVVYKNDNRCYFFIHSDSRNNLSFRYAVQVDNSGRHLHEVIYDDNGIPKVFTHFTYYSNHHIQTIDAKYFNGNKRLICNFFSDGKIRSAYEYGKGNRGNTVLRRSKEAHPSYGGYTSKLYDLDGNYERSINWGIGDESWLGIPDIETKPTTTIIDHYSHMSTDNPIFLKLIELVESIR